MAEYIERKAVEQFIENGLNNPDRNKAFGHDAIEIMAEVHYMPAADVAPVVHGRWERIGVVGKNLPLYPCCSACGGVSAAYRSQWEGYHGPWRYCPSCGAKMDRGADDAVD